MARISSCNKNFLIAFTERNMAHIIISLKGPGTEFVFLTTTGFASAVTQAMYFLSEEFWLILMST